MQLVESIFDRRSNVRLVVAMQGIAGLEIARERLPDLILLDLNLPDASGEEILGEIKANPQTAGIPVAVISADATPGQEERLGAAGAVTYLTKPFAVKSFLETIDELLKAA